VDSDLSARHRPVEQMAGIACPAVAQLHSLRFGQAHGAGQQDSKASIMTSPEDPEMFIYIARRIHRLGKAYASVERLQSTLAEESTQYQAAHTKLLCLLCEQIALEDLVLVMQPRTLTDAAVQLGIIFEELSEICAPDLEDRQQSDDMARELMKLRKALARITAIVADAAGVELGKICDPSLPARLEAVLSNTDIRKM